MMTTHLARVAFDALRYALRGKACDACFRTTKASGGTGGYDSTTLEPFNRVAVGALASLVATIVAVATENVERAVAAAPEVRLALAADRIHSRWEGHEGDQGEGHDVGQGDVDTLGSHRSASVARARGSSLQQAPSCAYFGADENNLKTS
jgi:hypothetical protein